MPRPRLSWLAGLLLAYLLVPVVAFLVRLPGTDWSETDLPGVSSALWLSIATASVSTAIIGVLGVPLGYLLARSTGRVTRVLGMLVQLPLALPPLISGILLVYLVGPYSPVGELAGGRLTDSVAGIVLAQIFVAAPFLIISARSAFHAVDPATEDVAATLGHGKWSRLLRVAMPGAAQGIRSGLMLSWLRAFGEFGATVVLAYNPHSLPVDIFVSYSESGVVGTTLPVLAVLATAAVVLLLAERRPRRNSRGHRQLPEPRTPAAVAGPLLDFAVAARVGGFRLEVGHTAHSPHLALLGASGAGKSATLRVLAGLLAPQSGHLNAGGADMLVVPPEDRGVGYLPQESTLLPHLRMAEQITFGVGSDAGVASYWARRLYVDELADRYPTQLSGGQQRRVALVRALARGPRILLLDEPFTGLDAPVRDELRRMLRTLQRETGLTTVLVTHDPEEAAMLAEEVLVLESGRVAQAGPQRQVFAHPVDPAVARLLGVRNLRTGAVRGAELADGGLRVAIGQPAVGQVSWCIRPEDVRLVPDGQLASVVDVMHLGALAELLVDAGGAELAVVLPSAEAPAVGARVQLELPPEAITVWPAPAPMRATEAGESVAGLP
ncbi:MAG: ATP-binding cassette domain-containing protein [Sciscionella sp.]